MTQPYWIIPVFASVMIVPQLHYVGITIWLPQGHFERLQYLIRLLMFTVGGPFISIAVLFYAVWNMDSFGWGKPRKGLTEDISDDSNGVIQKLGSVEVRSHLPMGMPTWLDTILARPMKRTKLRVLKIRSR
ncbi:hypothetical protein GQ53DRAFT_750642 [Thozetella sp. PMI_491]|nr:hypothetical protein GQ53DRAFT_750642 [Thozetella sp. PMI_491]